MKPSCTNSSGFYLEYRSYQPCSIIIWLGFISAPDIPAGDIWARTFHHRDFSAQGHLGTRTFWFGYILAPWKFWHRDVTALGHFDTKIFRHMYILAKCQKIPMPKCSCAKMSFCQKVTVMKCPCQNKPKPTLTSTK